LNASYTCCESGGSENSARETLARRQTNDAQDHPDAPFWFANNMLLYKRSIEPAGTLFGRYKIHTVRIGYETVHCVQITPRVYIRIDDLDKFVNALGRDSSEQKGLGRFLRLSDSSSRLSPKSQIAITLPIREWLLSLGVDSQGKRRNRPGFAKALLLLKRSAAV
jgi:hypothetical protein